MFKRALSAVLLPIFLLCSLPAFAATGSHAMVVTSDSRATQAALEVLQKGGNAVDALVAAQAVLNVVEPQASGIGGSGLLLFYDVGTRAILFFDGSVKAPGKAFPGMFLGEDKAPIPYGTVRTSGLAAGVPGTLKLLWEVHGKYKGGKLSFDKLLDRAEELAEKGTEVSAALSLALERNKDALRAADPKNIFLKNGEPLKRGDLLVQPELAGTFRAIQKEGPAGFYGGDISRAILKSVSGGKKRAVFLDENDFKTYDIAKREPLHGLYGGYDLFTAGPPSAGGTQLLAEGNVLSALNLAFFFGKPESIHFVAETMKVASLVPRAIGDPDSFELPVQELLSADWTEKQAAKIQTDKVYRKVPEVEDPDSEVNDPAGTSILIRDKAGNLVAYFGSLGDSFGSAITARGRGFFLNDLLLDFDRTPAMIGDPDSPNVPGPGQRPRSFAAPLFIFKEGNPAFMLNSPSGRDTSAVLLNMMVQGLSFKEPCEKINAIPRVFDRGGVMQMEQDLYDHELLRVQLELWGHKTEAQGSLGDGQVVCIDESSEKVSGFADPRGSGSAEGY